MPSGYSTGFGMINALPTSNHANSPETGFWEVAGAAKTIHAGWKWLSLALIRATSRPMVRTDTPNIAAHSA